MKPLRDLILVKEKKEFSGEKTDSGLYLISGSENNYNFKQDEDLRYDVMHREKGTKESLNNRLIEASKKRNGTYIEFFPGTEDVNLTQLEGNEALKDLVFGRSGNTGIVEEIGDGVDWVKKGDEVIFKKSGIIPFEKNLFFLEEKSVVAANNNIPPKCVVVKITKESRDNVFKRTVKTDSGETVNIFLPAAIDKMDERHSQFFVTCGEVMAVGEDVIEVKVGDIAILDYTQDNNEEIILRYEGEDKLIVVSAVSTFHTDNYEVEPANKRRQIVWQKGDIKELSNVLGVIRNGELSAVYPFVFLNHESTIISRKIASGIEYQEDQKILEREVLAISEFSPIVNKGGRVWVDDFDIFDVVLFDKEGQEMRVSCVNDIDLLNKCL